MKSNEKWRLRLLRGLLVGFFFLFFGRVFCTCNCTRSSNKGRRRKKMITLTKKDFGQIYRSLTAILVCPKAGGTSRSFGMLTWPKLCLYWTHHTASQSMSKAVRFPGSWSSMSSPWYPRRGSRDPISLGTWNPNQSKCPHHHNNSHRKCCVVLKLSHLVPVWVRFGASSYPKVSVRSSSVVMKVWYVEGSSIKDTDVSRTETMC